MPASLSDPPATRAARLAPSGRSAAEGSRKRADDWLAAGQQVLCEAGILGVKLATLTRRLGVSTGSFYHHFADFDDYLNRLADSYTAERVRQDIAAAIGDDQPGPIERIERLARQSLRAGTFQLDRAMRVWATMDPRAEAAIRRAEALVLRFVADAFRELGHDRAQSMLRARMLVAANVAQVRRPGGRAGSQFYRDCLRLLVGEGTQACRGQGQETSTTP